MMKRIGNIIGAIIHSILSEIGTWTWRSFRGVLWAILIVFLIGFIIRWSDRDYYDTPIHDHYSSNNS